MDAFLSHSASSGEEWKAEAMLVTIPSEGDVIEAIAASTCD